MLSVLDLGQLPRAAALKLRGKMQFANGQLFGRLGKTCLTEVTRHAYESSSALLGRRCRLSLIRFMQRLESNAGRVIVNFSSEPWYVFTDASYEPGESGDSLCGIGGVVSDQCGRPHGCFSAELSSELKRALGELTSRQIILEAECLR